VALDPQAQLAIAAGGLFTGLALAAGMWRRHQAGQLDVKQPIRTTSWFVAIMLGVTLTFASHVGAIIVAPGVILALGVWIRTHPARVAEVPNTRTLANLAIFGGAGGLIIGLVRLVTGT
jgi:hypothetical protein